MNVSALIDAAREVRERAFAPYSRFKVGAALETESGGIIGGCNVESASYGLTMCAERVALGRAVAEGHTRFTAVAVFTDAAELTPPCGACRQLLFEFAPDATVVLANAAGATERFTVLELLPRGFTLDPDRAG